MEANHWFEVAVAAETTGDQVQAILASHQRRPGAEESSKTGVKQEQNRSKTEQNRSKRSRIGVKQEQNRSKTEQNWSKTESKVQ